MLLPAHLSTFQSSFSSSSSNPYSASNMLLKPHRAQLLLRNVTFWECGLASHLHNPLTVSLPPPFCSVTTPIELCKHRYSCGLLHFLTLCYLNVPLCKALLVNLSLQHSLILCRVSMVVLSLLFCLFSSHCR